MLFTSGHLFRYMADFLSVNGHAIRAEIWQDGSKFSHASSMTSSTRTENTADEGQPQNGYIRVNVAADSPLVIETSDLSKEKPIHGSSASLALISEVNFQFLDLYTTDYLSTELRVYVDDTLYWSGHLDTEQYSEPFELKNNYQLQLTFNDFGVLKRVKLGKNAKFSLRQLLAGAFSRIGYALSNAELSSQSFSSTTINSTVRDDYYERNNPNNDIFTDLYVDVSNLGSGATCYDLLEGALKPLGLHLIQKAGKFTVYDLNYLATHDVTLDSIPWASDTQDLSVDKVYNNIEVNVSSNVGDKTSPAIFPNESFPKEVSQFDTQKQYRLPYFDQTYYGPAGQQRVQQLLHALTWQSPYSLASYSFRSRPFRTKSNGHFELNAHSRFNLLNYRVNTLVGGTPPPVVGPGGTLVPDTVNNHVPEPFTNPDGFATVVDTGNYNYSYANNLRVDYHDMHPVTPDNPTVLNITNLARAEYYFSRTAYTLYSLTYQELSSNQSLLAASPFESVSRGRYCHLIPVEQSLDECDVISLDSGSGSHINSIEPVLTSEMKNTLLYYHTLSNDTRSLSVGQQSVLPVAKLKPVRISAGDSSSFLNIEVPLLASCRVNPFDEVRTDVLIGNTADHSGSVNDIINHMDAYVKIFYLGLLVSFVDDETGQTYYYDNSAVVKRDFRYPTTDFQSTIGVWTTDPSTCYIAYYQTGADDRKNSSGLDDGKGFVSNHQAINPTFDALDPNLSDIGDGQFIPYPRRVDVERGDVYMSGEVSITIRSMYRGGVYNQKDNYFYQLEDSYSIGIISGCVSAFTTLLAKVPTVSFYTRTKLGLKSSEASDISYSTYVDDNISESLSVDCSYSSFTDELVGSLTNYSTKDSGDVVTFTRHGSSDIEVEANPGPAELLLCGTLYSQYHDRHIILSGDTFINDSTHTGNTDFVKSMMFTSPHPEMAGKKFMLSSSSIDLQADTQSSTLVETTEDVYIPQQL